MIPFDQSVIAPVMWKTSCRQTPAGIRRRTWNQALDPETLFIMPRSGCMDSIT